MPACCLSLASGKQVLHVERACSRLRGPSVFPSLSPPLLLLLLFNQQPHGCSKCGSIQLNHMGSDRALIHFWMDTHAHTHTPSTTLSSGYLAKDQKCKAMFWLGSTTCSQGSPNHGNGGGSTFFFSLQPFFSNFPILDMFPTTASTFFSRPIIPLPWLTDSPTTLSFSLLLYSPWLLSGSWWL